MAKKEEAKAPAADADGKPAGKSKLKLIILIVVGLLLAMGFDSLSMNATNLPKVKWLLRQITQSKARELLGQVMTMDNPHLIYSTLHLALRNLGLGRVINPASNIQA